MFGADLFKSLFEKFKDRPILVYGDPDSDGLISLKLMCDFCDMFGLKYKYFVNEHRHHGFTLSPSVLNGYLVLASDFTITESEVTDLVTNNVAILSTDHHTCQTDFIHVVSQDGNAEGIVINNQYPFEPEEDRYLSGAGVFYELICSIYPEFKTPLRDALVGITLLTDIRPTEGEKARAYLKKTFTINPSDPYISYLIKSTKTGDFSFGVPRMDRNFIDFTLSPTINALLRFNKTSEAVDFILGNGISSSAELRQSQSSLTSTMSDRMLVLDLPNVTILAVDASKFTDFGNITISDFIGLLCSDYKDKHGGKSTLCFTLANNIVTRASFMVRYDDVHYLSGFRHIDLDANGHGNAFGIKNFEPTQDTWIQINDVVGELESGHEDTIKVYTVSNLAIALNKTGSKLANENCYVRDCFRSYYKYTGTNIIEVKHTYKSEPFTTQDKLNGLEPDFTSRGVSYKYTKGIDGEKITKYIEYLVDGRTVKSFGVPLKDGIILPMLENGYLQLYVRSMLS